MERESVHIRPAELEEADVLTRLCRRAKASWGYPENWLEAWSRELSFTPEYIAAHAVLVATHQESIMGVGALGAHENGLEVDHLWVDPHHQAKGVGSSLLLALLEQAKALHAGSVYILSDPFARPFYEKHGAHFISMQEAPVLGTPRSLPVLVIDLQERVI